MEIVRNEAKANKIDITACRATTEGQKIFTKTPTDFRKIKNKLET